MPHQLMSDNPQQQLGFQSLLKMNGTLGQAAVQMEYKTCCSNCGSQADRIHSNGLTQTSCQKCDYFIICTRTGQVLEAYAPGIYPHRLTEQTD